MKKSPLLTLNNGIEMPALGLGVYQSTAEETADAVKTSISHGYRLIDTAAAYGNEQQVGKGIAQSDIDRDELFVITKLWISDYGFDHTLHAFERSMRKLALEQLDLYLLHWPMPTEWDRTVEAWKAAGKLLVDGRVRAIGVCNFSPTHLDRLIDETGIVPALNQVELHPFFVQEDVRAGNAKHGVITQAWSPIGGVNRYWVPEGKAPQDPLQHPTIVDLARRYDKTPAQIILRWHLDHGFSAIPKSVRPARIAENFDIFDFSMSSEEVEAIDALNKGVRGGPDPETVDTKLFNFAIEE